MGSQLKILVEDIRLVTFKKTLKLALILRQTLELQLIQNLEALKTVKRLCKEFGFTAGMLKGALAKGRGEK